MMSITPIKSAGNAAQYYLAEEKSNELPNLTLEQEENGNYYLREKSQEENTFWFGQLAKDAGIDGKPIDEKTLEEVLSGQLGDETIKGKKENHKSGFDLTFSAPKSISIMALVGGDARLIEAHNNAIKFTLSELEKDAAQAKVTEEKGVQAFQNTESMLFGVIQHKTSRENDPQLHSHVLTANMTRDQKGELRALASSLKQNGGVINGTSERIYNFQKYYSALYQSTLAKSVSEELGYEVRGIGNGQFELKVVPESLIETFSSRSQQIKDKVTDLGFDSQKTRDLAAKNTRKEKSYLDEKTLNEQWKEKAQVDVSQYVIQNKENPTQATISNDQAIEAVNRSIAHLEQYSTALNINKLIEKAANDFTQGEQANLIDIKQVTDNLIKNGELIPTAEKGVFTTKGMIEKEKELMGITQGRAMNMMIRPDKNVLDQLNLNNDNVQKITALCESTKQFNVVNVFGQSQQVAKSLLTVGNLSQKRVHLISQTNKEAQDNKSNWINKTFKEDQHHSLTGFLKNTEGFTNKDVLLVDNAGKMSANELIQLTQKAKESQSKVIFLNQVSSQQGFKAHNSFDLYSKGNVSITQWVNNKYTDATISLHDQKEHELAKQYAQAPDKNNIQVLATSTVDQRRLTEVIRETLQNEGQLSRHTVSLDAQHLHFMSPSEREMAKNYQTGMMLRHWDKGKPHDFIVTKQDSKENTVHALSKNNGSLVEFNVLSPEFKALDMQVFKPSQLDIAVGEQLTAKSHFFPAQLKQNETYQVQGFSDKQMTLLDSKGKEQTVSLSELKDAPLAYNYVKSSNQIDDKAQTLLFSKSFALSKELINDVTARSEQISIFTDNTEKAQDTINKSEYRPSATERVLQTMTNNDRLLSSATVESITKDVHAALSALDASQQISLIESAVNFAINHVSEKEAGFTQKELVLEAVRYAFEEKNQAISKQEIEQELSRREDTLSAEYSDGTRWTTQEALNTEKAILSNFEQGQNKHTAFATPEQTRTFLDGRSLTQGQKDAITLISTTKNTFVAIQGLAGTGKSTMLESNIDLIQEVKSLNKEQAQQVIGLAPTHAAVSELQKKGVEAQTLESLLTDVRTGHKTSDDYKNTLFFLDESSMVSNKQALELTNLVLNSDSKAALLGDKEQLLSLSAGKPFELGIKQGAIDVAYMTDIVRQQNETLLGAVHNVLDKQPQSALKKLEAQSVNTTAPHVISTLDESRKDKAEAMKEASENLYKQVAQDYLGRTSENRENTLIIAYTNNDRDQITHHIRDGLIENKELGKENIMAYRLRSIGASREELATMMPYQKGMVISTKVGQYGVIESVNKEHGLVVFKDSEDKQHTFLPLHNSHKFTSLFVAHEMPLSTNDKIVTRFTDKTRNIKANVEYKISSVDKKGIQAIDKNGNTLSIDPKSLKDGHWDYAYTRTADMAQGTTYTNVITAIKGQGALTNFRRAYIDLTRASNHIRLYTDNPKAMMKSWLSREVNKQSAIETIGNIAPQNTVYFNNTPILNEDARFQDKQGNFNFDKAKEHIHNELPKFTESLAKEIIGKPNLAKSNKDYLVFGSGKEGITVSLTGEYRGYFKDYSTGEKGSLINLLMSHKMLSYKEALNEANNMINNPKEYNLSENPNHDKLKETQPKHIAQYESYARSYFAQSQEVKGTLTEHYLSSLGIHSPQNENVRHHDGVYSSEDKQAHPAMIANIHDKNGNTRAIEITYLNSDGQKDPNLEINPRVLGTKSKHLTMFNEGSNLNTTIISTSIENSFILNENMNNTMDILNVNDKNDIQNISTDELRQNVVIILDKENANLNQNNIDSIVANFQDRNIHIIDSADFVNEVKSCIERIEHQHNELINHDNSQNENMPIDNSADKHLTQVYNERQSEQLDINHSRSEKENELNISHEKEMELQKER